MEAYLLIARLRSAFPAAEMPDETVEVYAEFLEPCDAERMRQAVDDTIRECRFLPSIAELVQAYAARRPRPRAELGPPAATAEQAREAIDRIRAELKRARPRAMP